MRKLIVVSVAFFILTVFLCSNCGSNQPFNAAAGFKNSWQGATPGSNVKRLGMSDFNASYSGFLAKVKPGERVTVKGEFPHSRYVGFVVYDEDFMVVDSIPDTSIVPSKGVNPFQSGANRSSKWLGEYQLNVLMEPPPKGNRPPNTLYAGLNHKGKSCKIMMLTCRVYLPDKEYGYRVNNPLAVFGGVTPPQIQLFDKNGKPYLQSETAIKLGYARIIASIFKANREKLRDPMKFLGGEPLSPPIWMNNASRETQRESTYIPNDETAYIAAPVSDKFGELLVLRWKASATPVETFYGKPFPENYDMRYWSLTFCYIDKSERVVALSEKTIADVDAPTLPDGTRQIVVGFGGMKRPDAVPPEQWVGLNLKNGFIVMRNILINPAYAGDFGKMRPGKIIPEYDQFTPGGVYCSVEEFAKNPNIGLNRKIK